MVVSAAVVASVSKWSINHPKGISLTNFFLVQLLFPKVDELVQVIYVNKDFQYQNQYYVQNTFSSPTTTGYEYYQGGNKFTATGFQLKNPKPLNILSRKVDSSSFTYCLLLWSSWLNYYFYPFYSPFNDSFQLFEDFMIDYSSIIIFFGKIPE